MTPTAGLATTEAGGHGDLHGGAQHAADGGRDDRAELERPDGRHGRAGEPDVFTAANWNVAQTVTVTGVDDARRRRRRRLHDRDGAGDEHRPELHRRQRGRRRGDNTDNDSRGHHGDADGGLATTEAGGTATFTVVLNTQPTADVTIALSSSDTTEGTVGPASLTFTTANWNVAQTVTVTGVDDAAGRRRRRLHDRDGAGDERRPELQRRQRGRRGGDATPTTTRRGSR